MTITKEILEQAKEGMRSLERTGRNCYVYMSRDEPRRIEWMVEKWNPYFCGQCEDVYVYWDSFVYGFTFEASLFAEKP